MSGGSALSTTKAVSEALVKLARKNAEDKTYESPYTLEWAKSEGVTPQSGFGAMFSGYNKFKGGKMDDIVVVVGKVVATDDSAVDLKEAVAASEQLAQSMEAARDEVTAVEAKTAKRVQLRRDMYGAINEKRAEADAADAENPPAL
eukprot:gnl/MRDRNA2_/MRDRNA2_68674_c0_seq1.p1 gnl/MRDRNA2_/MRDRNA2_68674_c0~~gnl/MRDRNA2_/MRDRNA2_68674_c0_seq1.p1  ORF type:complete len:146 (+),score=37.86 gnl/MRDRNA2_/MRDRNA2_68674_c0_seq1:305-742(+)